MKNAKELKTYIEERLPDSHPFAIQTSSSALMFSPIHVGVGFSKDGGFCAYTNTIRRLSNPDDNIWGQEGLHPSCPVMAMLNALRNCRDEIRKMRRDTFDLKKQKWLDAKLDQANETIRVLKFAAVVG